MLRCRARVVDPDTDSDTDATISAGRLRGKSGRSLWEVGTGNCAGTMVAVVIRQTRIRR